MFSLHIQRYSNQLLAYSYLPRSKQHVIVSIKYVPENFIIEIQQWRSNLVFLPGELLCGFLRLTRQDVVERLRVERLEVDLLVVVPVLVALHLDRARCKQPTLCRMMTSRATSLPHVRWIFTHRCTFLLACTVDIYALKAVARCTSLVKALDILKQCDVTQTRLRSATAAMSGASMAACSAASRPWYFFTGCTDEPLLEYSSMS